MGACAKPGFGVRGQFQRRQPVVPRMLFRPTGHDFDQTPCARAHRADRTLPTQRGQRAAAEGNLGGRTARHEVATVGKAVVLTHEGDFVGASVTRRRAARSWSGGASRTPHPEGPGPRTAKAGRVSPRSVMSRFAAASAAATRTSRPLHLIHAGASSFVAPTRLRRLSARRPGDELFATVCGGPGPSAEHCGVLRLGGGVVLARLVERAGDVVEGLAHPGLGAAPLVHDALEAP